MWYGFFIIKIVLFMMVVVIIRWLSMVIMLDFGLSDILEEIFVIGVLDKLYDIIKI